MSSAASSPQTLFELAKLYAARCDFEIALEKATEASEGFLARKDYSSFVQCQNLLLRMYAEKNDADSINATKERLQDFVLKEGFELNAKTYYTLGICSMFKNQYEVALDYFQKSLAIALTDDNKEDMCYAITGLAGTYAGLGRLTDALREIYNLQVFFEVLDLPELKLSNQIRNGVILRGLERYDQALEVLWDCYDTLKQDKNLYMYLHLLYEMGVTYKSMNEPDMARIYLQLVKRTLDPANLKRLSEQVELALQELGFKQNDQYDLVFNPFKKSVLERKRGKIDFKNQFILLDLLHLFIKSPGTIFSKELIAHKIWAQDYDPAVHDNKIYVTIKRLRRLIEPDFDKPKYIFRAKNGYYLNKNTRILMEQQ